MDGDCPQHRKRDRAHRAASGNGRRRRMGHPRGAPEPCNVPGRRTGHPRDAPSGRGAGQSTSGQHPEPVIATGRRMEHPGGASPALREGWGTLRMQLQRWKQDRAPRGCTQSPPCHWRMGHSGVTPPCPGKGCGTLETHPNPIIVTKRRTEHPGGTSLGIGKGQSILGVHPESIFTTGRRIKHPWGACQCLGKGCGTPGMDPEPITATGRRM